jgi:hypothetical protein
VVVSREKTVWLLQARARLLSVTQRLIDTGLVRDLGKIMTFVGSSFSPRDPS